MAGRKHVEADVMVDAPVDDVFEAFTDWQRQGEWMVGTKVEVRKGDGQSVGSELAAWTGAGPVGFWDYMTITRWEPPYRVDVVHTGSVVKGTGTMEVLALPQGRSRFVWSEDLDIPLGLLGRIGFPIVKPGFMAGVKHSLKSFARWAEKRTNR